MIEIKIVVDKLNYDDVFRKYMDSHFFKGTIGYFMKPEKQEREILKALNSDGWKMVEGIARNYSVHVKVANVIAYPNETPALDNISGISGAPLACPNETSALKIKCRLSDVDYNSLFHALADNTSGALRWLVLGLTVLTWRGMKESLTLVFINVNGKKLVKKIAKKKGIRMDVKMVHACRCQNTPLEGVIIGR